jgi:hypothetical protein
MRSGFGGFNKLSSVSTGKKNFIDGYSTLTNAILSVLGNTNAQIFTTASPSTITVITSGSTDVVSRWDPTYAPSSSLHLTQSTLSNMPTYDSVKKLGNTFGVRGIVDDTLIQNSYGPSTTTAHTFLIYAVYTSYSVGGDDFLAPNWNQVGAASQIYGIPRAGTFNASAGNAITSVTVNAVTTGLGFRRAIATAGSAATVHYPTSNFFRSVEATINTARTGSMSLYDQNGDLFNTNAFSLAGGLASVNKTSCTFTQTSISSSGGGGFSTADWDAMFPGDAYKAMKIQILRSSLDASVFSVIFVPAILTANQVKQVKQLLDQAHGVS